MANGRIYNLKRWKILRLEYLASHPFCEMCGIGISSEVDHIRPINAGGEPWDESNFQALCHSCHSVKTAGKDHAFGNRAGSRAVRAKGCTADGRPLDIHSEWRKDDEKGQKNNTQGKCT